MKSSLTVYKASAGSGKTFTLAIQYIKTLIEQESRHAYSHILPSLSPIRLRPK